jgi:hypothetical protein
MEFLNSGREDMRVRGKGGEDYLYIANKKARVVKVRSLLSHKPQPKN